MKLDLLRELELISEHIGVNPMLIQGSGGNSSIKIGEEMFIKASGKWLADASKKKIFVNVSWKKINQNVFQKKKEPLLGTIIGDNSLRPSIESTLHALMPFKVVLHTHPVELLSLLARKNVKSILKNLLQDLNWIWVDYACPGIELTKKVQAVLNKKNVEILILENHGLVVGSESCQGVVNLTQELERRFRQPKRFFNISDEKKLQFYSQKLNMKPANNSIIHSLAIDNTSYKYCSMQSTILYPDQAVFLGPKLNCIKIEKGLTQKWVDKKSEYVILGGEGVFVAENAKPEIEEMLTCHSEILLRIPSNIKLKYLKNNEVSDLLGWEAEIYRQNIKR